MSKLQRILKECFAMIDSEYTDDQSLMQLKDFDSMNHMLFVTKLEEEFGIELTGDEIVTMEKIGDVKNVLLSKNVDLTEWI